MTHDKTHITVCICTYKRPALLKRLLDGLATQETGGLFTYSIVVAENDVQQSALDVVAAFAAVSSIPVTYCAEPRQNIALARNKAVENATGDFVAFIDDDEFPTGRWLLTLFNACHQYDVDGVLGPVKPYFDDEPPKWVIEGRFYERRTYPTGFVIDRGKGRTGNVLLRKRLFEEGVPPFRPEFLTGEDQDFFGRMIEKGHVFVWCNEAVAYEVVPAARWNRTFMFKRGLLSGKISLIEPSFGVRAIAKSVVAVSAYTTALPVALVFGQRWFMTCVVKLSNHLGRLLALLGIDPVGEPYVTD